MYLKQELMKIKKSKSFLIILLVTLSYSIIVYSEYLYSISRSESFFIFFYKSVSGFTGVPIVNIGAIVFTSLLFAKEFEDRTIIYIFMRPIKCGKLFLGKILAIIIYSFAVTTILFLITLVLSISFFELKSLPGDISMANSFIRCLVCILYTFVGILISIGLSCLISVITRNQVGSIILSSILFMFTSVAHFTIWNYTIPISTYYNTVNYFTVNFNTFIVKCRNFTILNLFVIFVLTGISYYLLMKLRTGLKNY